jgi:hypothetical protein
VGKTSGLAEEMLSGEQFVEQNSESEEVGGGGNGLPLDLLRTAVLRGQDNRADWQIGIWIGVWADKLCDSEIEQLDGSGFVHDGSGSRR